MRKIALVAFFAAVLVLSLAVTAFADPPANRPPADRPPAHAGDGAPDCDVGVEFPPVCVILGGD